MSDLHAVRHTLDKPLHDARDRMTFLAAALRSAVLHETPDPEMNGAALAAEDAARLVQKALDLLWPPERAAERSATYGIGAAAPGSRV
jgi:hypothetical protein